MTKAEVDNASTHVTIIEPGKLEANYWRDLWRFRELFAVLAWRDIAVRYKQTAIGVAWAVIRPFVTMVVFTVVFGGLAKLPSDGDVPYAVLVFAGLLPWFLFSSVLSDSSLSLVVNAPLVGKVYFPRIVIPVAAAMTSVLDMMINLSLLIAVMAFFSFTPDWRILLLPIFMVFALVAAVGPALLLSALNVKYRDFRFLVPFIVQFGLYVSPVGFSSAIVPEQWRWLYSMNPIVGVIDGFRWCLLGGRAEIYLPGLVASVVLSVIILWFGVRYFRRTERTFADVI